MLVNLIAVMPCVTAIHFAAHVNQLLMLVISCSLSLVTAWCAQVLEELQKVKVHCKDCEMKNDTLQTELEELQQKLKVNVLLAAFSSCQNSHIH